MTHDKCAGVIIEMNRSAIDTKEDYFRIWRPFDLRESGIFQVKAPQAIAVNAANDDGSILIDDADFLAIAIPRHSSYNRLVTIVNHLFVPWI